MQKLRKKLTALRRTLFPVTHLQLSVNRSSVQVMCGFNARTSIFMCIYMSDALVCNDGRLKFKETIIEHASHANQSRSVSHKIIKTKKKTED